MISIGRKYILNVLVAFDQLLNAILLGDPDETISSRAAKRLHMWHWNKLAIFLEWIDPGHMKRTLEKDEGKDSVTLMLSNYFKKKY
jgi:hypothetical protein